MKILSIISVVVVGLALYTGCKKMDMTPTIEVSFTIDQPTENANITFDEYLHMEGTINGTGSLHGYTIELIDQADNSVDYSNSSSTHASEYYFHEHFQNTVSQTTNYTLQIEVNLDHDSGATETKDLNVVFVQE